jgi:hypothetical protein
LEIGREGRKRFMRNMMQMLHRRDYTAEIGVFDDRGGRCLEIATRQSIGMEIPNLGMAFSTYGE